MATSRLGPRLFQSARNKPLFYRNPFGRRFQSVDAAQSHQPPQSTFQRLWNSPVGMKTVHFWAPVMKWALVLAGVSDFARPAESLSATQNGALTATGMIWTRWCFIIKPRNVFLAAVNFFLACVGVTQLTRIALWQRSQRDASAGQVAQEGLQDVKGSIKDLAKDAEETAKKITK